MYNNTVKNKEAFVYFTYLIKARAVTISLGTVFLPIILILSNKTIVFWSYLILLIVITSLLGRIDADWKFNLLKRHLNDYEEIGSFWIKRRKEVLVSWDIGTFYKNWFKSFICLGEWKYFMFFFTLYLTLVIAPLFIKIIHVKLGYEIMFIIALMYTVMSFHYLFLFLQWKYRVTKKIKEEYGFDYKDLILKD